MKYSKFFVLILFTLFYSCSEDQPLKTTPKFELTNSSSVPEFNGGSAFEYIEKQLAFGPRNPNSKGHQTAKYFLINELKENTDSVIIQNFEYTGYDDERLQLSNIIGVINPDADNRIFITAHWDTRPRAEQDPVNENKDKPIPGANDGASGTAVILELANILKHNKIDFGIDLVLLDGEDYGKEGDLTYFCIGAKYFAAKMGKDYKPAFGILLDLVGDKDAVFFQEQYSLQYAPDIVNLIWQIAQSINADKFKNLRGSGIYDDHVPLNQAGFRTIDIIDAELVGGETKDPRRKYWHTQNDNIENIGEAALQQVGSVLVNLIYKLKFNTIDENS